MENNAKKGAILFLHGYTQNAKIFEKRLKVLLKAVSKEFPEYEIIIPDAPFTLENENEGITNEEEIKKGWLYLEGGLPSFEKETELTYFGFNESLQTLEKIFNEKKVKCIFSFSQGSLLQLLLFAYLKLNPENKLTQNVLCSILVAGFCNPLPLNFPEFVEIFKKANDDIEIEDKFPIPSLHVFGEDDAYILPSKSISTSRLFNNPEIFKHKGKHFIPSGKEDVEIFINFMKKYLKNDS
jgi:hypothetical protein